MRRLLPYLILAFVVPLMVFYGSGVTWSASNDFNITPDSQSVNWTIGDWTSGYAFNLTIGYNKSNANGWTLINITALTSIKNSASQVADIILGNNATPFNQINVSNFNYTNATISFNASLLNPGHYSGNLSIVNASNSSIKINTFSIVLDVPTTFNSTYFISNNFFGNLSSTNRFDVFYINVSSSNGLYVNVNESAADLLLFDPSGTLVAYNNTNASCLTCRNKTLLYPFPSYNGLYQLKVFYNSTNASAYNGIVMFSPLNSSVRFLDFGRVNSTSGALNISTITLVLNNTGMINLTAVVEVDNLAKIERHVNSQNSTNITVPIANHYNSIDVTLEWNNAYADFNLTIYNSSKLPIANQSKRINMFNVTGLGFERIFSRVVANINEYNTSWYVSVNGDRSVYYNLTINLNVAQNWLNSSLGNHAGWYVFNSTQSNASVDFNLTVPVMSSNGIYNGTITLYAGAGNRMSIPFGMNVTVPMLMVNDSFSQKLLYITDNIGSNKTTGFVFFLNNTGSYPLTLTDTNSTWLNNTLNTLGFNYTFGNPINAAGSTLFKLSINTTTMNAGGAVYYGWIKLNSTDAHPYSDFLINVTFNLTNKLNVVVYNATNNNSGGAWIEPINKTANTTTITTTNPVFANITVNVTFQNNTFVGILNATNFTVWLQNEFPYEGSNYTFNFTNVTIGADTNINQNIKTYVLNLSIPSTIPGGNYSVFVKADDSNSTMKNSGTGKFNYLYINSSALVISLSNGTNYGDEFVNIGNRYINVTVTNVGGGALDNVSVELSLTGGGSCAALASGYTSVYNIRSLSGFSSYSNNTLWSVNIGANSTCTPDAIGYSPSGVWILNDTTYTITYTGSVLSTGINNPGGGSGTLVPSLTLLISTDKSAYLKGAPVSIVFNVTSSITKVSGVSVKYSIKNPSGTMVLSSSCTTDSSGQCTGTYTPSASTTGTFTISSNATKDGYSTATATKTFVVAGYSAAITNYAKSIYLLQGTSNSTTLTVNNNGVHDETITLTIKDLDSSWWNASKTSAALSTGQSTDFTVNFNVPKDAVVKNYTLSYSVSADAELDSEYFYMVVLPTENTKTSISALLDNYTSSLSSLISRLNVTQALAANNTDLKLAADKINEAAALISAGKNYSAAGDFVKANELAIQAKSLMDVADALIKPVEMSQGNKRNTNIIMAAGVIAVLAIIGVIAYMLLPEPGYSSKKGYTPPEHAGEAGKIKRSAKKIVDKIEETIDGIKDFFDRFKANKKEYRMQPGTG